MIQRGDKLILYFIILFISIMLLIPFAFGFSAEDFWKKITGKVSDTPTSVSFNSSTPTDNSVQADTSIFVDVSSSSSLNHSVFVDFDESLRLRESFDSGSSGIRGSSRQFTSQDSLNLGSSNYGLNNINELTLSFWINIKNDTTSSNVIIRGLYGYPYWIGIQDNKPYNQNYRLRYVIRTDNTYSIYSDNLNYDTWYYVTTTYENGESAIYIDGTKKSSKLVAGNLGFGPTLAVDTILGKKSDSPSGFSGFLDELLIFNRRISDSEILSLYNANDNHYQKTFSGLNLGIHSFQAYAVDSSGNVATSETREVTIGTINETTGTIDVPNSAQKKDDTKIYVVPSVCGNDICEVGENNLNCPNDCDVGEKQVVIIDNSSTKNCQLLKAYWNATIIKEGENIPIIVEGKDCNREKIYFSIYEEDTFQEGGVDVYMGSENYATFSSNFAIINWKTIFHNDCNGTCLPSEIYFIVNLSLDSNKTIKSSNRLSVYEIGDESLFKKPKPISTTDGAQEQEEIAEEFVEINFSCIDEDKDGFNKTQKYCGFSDCDDNNQLVTPFESEVCDGIDNNCDGIIDPNCTLNDTCEILSIYLNSNKNIPGASTEIVVEGKNCDGYKLIYEIYESDPFNNFFRGDDLVTSFISNFTSSWKITYTPDFFGDPEYYVIVKLADGRQIKTEYLLKITEVPDKELPLTSEFDGNTTDFKKQGIYNLSYFVLEKQGFGKIEFYHLNESLQELDLNSEVTIEHNFVEIKAENIPELNSSAIITFYNLNFENPIILKNGEICKKCKILDYQNGNLKFSVEYFSNYSAEDMLKMHYIRQDATGNNDGTDWDNAWTTIPEVLQRNHTYYISDGYYSGYIFDDAVNGTQYITIKKANLTEHGTDIGWNNLYGDGQAVFNSSNVFNFITGYYVIDGQNGGGVGSWDKGYGFKLIGQKGMKLVDIKGINLWNPPMPNNIELKHIELQGYGLDVSPGDYGVSQNFFPKCNGGSNDKLSCNLDSDCPGGFCADESYGSKNILISNCYFHNLGIPILTKYATNWTFKNNYILRQSSFSGYCAEDNDGDNEGLCLDIMLDEPGARACTPIDTFYDNGCPTQISNAWTDYGSDNIIIENNIFKDIEGSSYIALTGYNNLEKPSENWEIYGNVFYYGSGNIFNRKGVSNGVIGTSADDVANNIKIYNNVFANILGEYAGIYFTDGSTGIEVYNNIWYNSSIISLSNNILHDYNWFYGNYNYKDNLNTDSSLVDNESYSQLGIQDPFIDSINGNFRLKQSTNSGIDLPKKYETDAYGNIRGQDENWDRGAYEFIGITEPLVNISINKTNNITQYGITWYFDKEYEYGTFANGDYWILGPVIITKITPDFEEYHNGWQVNPTNRTAQGYEYGAGNFDAKLVPTLPYSAKAGESIVKSVSRFQSNVSCSPLCLKKMAVLTVVGEIPPDNGATVFRPSYIGTNKKYYSINDVKTELIPSLAPVIDMPLLETSFNDFKMMQMDYMGGLTGRNLRPEDNMGADSHGTAVGRRTSDAVLILMINDSLELKMPLLISLLQYGIDLNYAIKNGQIFEAGGGHENGRKIVLALTATLFNDDDIKNSVNIGTFEEDTALYYSEIAKTTQYGFTDGCVEDNYWSVLVTGSGNKACIDPYKSIHGGWIRYDPREDTGHPPLASNYEYSIFQPSKAAVVAMILIPELRVTWNNDVTIDYMDRWTNIGFWMQPDSCAPVTGICKGEQNDGNVCTFANISVCSGGHCLAGICSGNPTYAGMPCGFFVGPNSGYIYDSNNPYPCGIGGICILDVNSYKIDYGPDSNNPGDCIKDTNPNDGIGRFPQMHNRGKDGIEYTGHAVGDFQIAMWNAYRGVSCYNGICEPGENIETCPYDCKEIINCDLTSALWNQTTALNNSLVGLNIQGINCAGQQINYSIYEDDLIGDDLVDSFVVSSLSSTWTTKYVNDISGNPEYYFTATLVSNKSESIQSSNLLDVSLPIIPPTCSDRIQNGNETGIDCGGECIACVVNIKFPIVINHTAVDDFDNIPNEYIEKSKKMLIQWVGESHARQVTNGLEILEQTDSKYSFQLNNDLALLNESDSLRILRALRTIYNGWSSDSNGDAEYWATENFANLGRASVIRTAQYAIDQKTPLNLSIWGPCWDACMVNWVHLENGTTVTLNDERINAMFNTYLRYNNNASINQTVFVYPTFVTDCNSEEGRWRNTYYSELIRQEAIKNNGILFDNADIESWNNNNTLQRTIVDSQGRTVYLRNLDYEEDKLPNSYPGTDHTNDALRIRKAKALWVLLARLNGWNGSASTQCTLNSQCNDGLYCNGIETCQSGSCVSGNSPCVADTYSCTTTCNETTDSCNVKNNLSCNDNNICTNDICLGIGGNATTGCSFTFNTNSCNDNIACTQNDICDLGICSGTAITQCINNDNCCPAICNELNDNDCANQGAGPTDYILYLPFNGNSNDESGNGNNGIVNGAVLTTDRNGNLNSAYYFDGVDDYIDIQRDLGIDGNEQSFTLSVWVNTSDATGNHFVFGSPDSTYLSFNFGLLDGNLFMSWRNARNYYISTGRKINRGFHHVVSSYDSFNDDLEIYIDGVRVSQFYSYANSNITEPYPQGIASGRVSTLNIGRGFSAGITIINSFNGTIDEIKVYNRSLSAQEVLAVYNGTQVILPTCSDRIQNGDETGIDCGGSCVACSTCSDSDGGINYFVKGTCVDLGGTNPESCVTSNLLVEYYCNNSVCSVARDPISQQFAINCENGCSDGACIPTPSCDLTSASWNQTTALNNTLVGLDVKGTNCAGQQINYSIYEDDIAGDDLIDSFVVSSLSSTWKTKYVNDISGNPEYYFTATLVNNKSESIQSSNLLDVSLPIIPPTCSDGIQNGNETGIDCGGECIACVVNISLTKVHYVRADATGTNNGSDWTNAWNEMNQINWNIVLPGDTIYIAAGTYTQTLSIDKSGTLDKIITIKRATNSEHGENIGWNSNMDSYIYLTQGSYISIQNNRYIYINGVDNKFIIIFPSYFATYYGLNIQNSDNINIENLNIDAEDDGTNDYNLRGVYLINDNLLRFNHLIISNTTNDHFMLASVNNSIIENCIFNPRKISTLGACGVADSSCHADGLEVRETENITFRNNIVKSSNIIFQFVTYTAENRIGRWDIYGNVFSYPDAIPFSVTIKTNSKMIGNNVGPINIYNNVFYNSYLSMLRSEISGIWDVKNNIFYNVTKMSMDLMGTTHDYNYFMTPTGNSDSVPPNETNSFIGDNPFIDSANGDFRLKNITAAGISLPSPYNIDMLGNIRGADGNWDRGAYEFVNGTIIPTPSCDLTSASWNQTIALNNTLVELDVKGTNCAGQQINYSIYEDDLIGDDLVDSFIVSSLSSTWTTKYVNDISGNPEYYFTVTLVNNASESIQSSNLLDVSLPIIPPTCSDGIQNGNETGIDCGGECIACVVSGNRVELSDSNNNILNNFTTIQPCASIVQAGQTCLVYPGVYDETFVLSSSGSLGNKITIKSKQMNSVLIKGITLTGSYVIIDGFNITNIGANGITITGNYNEILNNSLSNIQRYGISASGSNNIIKNNKIYMPAIGMSISGSLNLIENNDIERIYHHGIFGDCDYTRFFGSNYTFRNNYFHGTSPYSDDTCLDVSNRSTCCHVDCWQTWDASQSAQNILIENNTCIGFSEGLMLEGTTFRNNSNIILRYNILARGLQSGANFQNTKNILFEHNTVVDMHRLENTFCFGTWTRYQSSNVVLRNNLFYDFCDNAWYVESDTFNVLVYNNLRYLTDIPYPAGTNNIIADPMFVDLNNNNFTPQANSPACTAADDGSFVGALPCAGGIPTPSCDLISASWNQTTALNNTLVGLDVKGTNCAGQQINYSIYEDDIAGDDLVDSFVISSLSSTWKTKYVNDISGNPEYYFTATLVSNKSESIQSSNLLDVSLPIIPPTCGNNIIEANEVCDGTNISKETCITQGFDSGILSCLNDCSGYDTSECVSPIVIQPYLNVSLISPENVNNNSFNLIFNITGSYDFYKCIPYMEMPLSSTQKMFMPLHPIYSNEDNLTREDPMLQLVKYKKNGIYKIPVWHPNGNYKWNIMCEGVKTIELNLSLIPSPRLIYSNGSSIYGLSLGMGDFIKINSPRNGNNYSVSVNLMDRTEIYTLDNNQFILTTRINDSGESIFIKPNNMSAMMPYGCPNSSNPGCPIESMYYSKPYYLNFRDIGTGIYLGNLLAIYINPIIQPPQTTLFENGIPPQPIINLNGVFDSQNKSLLINGDYEYMYNFENQICTNSNLAFCDDISEINQDNFYFKEYEDCTNGLDDDRDGYIDRQDSDCSWMPNYNQSTLDDSVPLILRTKTFSFDNHIIFDFKTDILTQAKIILYNVGVPKTGSSYTDEYVCSNMSRVLYENYKTEIPVFVPFHHMEADNLASSNSYFYEISACSQTGKCAISYCKRVETNIINFENTDFNLELHAPEKGDFVQQPIISLVNQEIVSNLSSGIKRNIKNQTIRFEVPSENILIDFKGINLIYNYTLNFSNSFTKSNDSSGRTIVGMKHSNWLDIVQNLNVEEIDITLPSDGSTLYKCDDSGENCYDITSRVQKKLSAGSSSTWTIPISLGFSTYKVIEDTIEEPPIVPPVTSPSGGGGSSGGGGGGGGSSSPIINLRSPTNFNVNTNIIYEKLTPGTIKQAEFTITNPTNSQINITLSSDLKMLIMEGGFVLAPQESRVVKLDIVIDKDENPDLYLGNIYIKSGNSQKEILISLEIQSKDTLFDLSVNLPEKYSYVSPGKMLTAEISLAQVKEETNLKNIIMNYIIKNEEGEIIFSEKEIIEYNLEKSFVKTITIPEETKTGVYALYVQLNYNGKIASASKLFNIGTKPINKYLLFGGLILIIIILIMVVLKLKKKF